MLLALFRRVIGTASGPIALATISLALFLVIKFKAYVAMLRCRGTSPDAREKE